MRKLKDMIQELVHLRGNLQFQDLTAKERKTILAYAIADARFDEYEIFIEGMQIAQLTKSFLEGIYDENSIGCELLDRIEDYFEPLLDKLFEDEYLDQFCDKTDLYYREAI